MKGDTWVRPRGCCRVIWEGEDGVYRQDVGDRGKNGCGRDV